MEFSEPELSVPSAMSQLLLMRSEGNELPVFAGDSWDEAVTTWQALEDSAQAHLWHMGAIADSITARYGEADVKRFAYEVRRSTRRIYQLATTYRAFKDKKRSEILTFTHHQIAAEHERPEEMITLAEVEELSTRQLEAKVKNRTYEPLPDETLGGAPDGKTKALAHWYGWIKARPCLRCGATQHVEAAHIRGFVSFRTGDVLPRSHKGLQAYSCVPLCVDCHREADDSVHAVGEAAFFERLGRSKGFVFKWLATALAEFFTQERELWQP